MNAAIQTVDLDLVRSVTLCGRQDLPLPAMSEVVELISAPDQQDEPESNGEEIPIPDLSLEIISFEDFHAMHWGMMHEGVGAMVSKKAKVACDLGSIGSSAHGRTVALRIYETLSKSPLARRTILSTGSAMMETGFAVYMYLKEVRAEIVRCVGGAEQGTESDEEIMFKHEGYTDE